VAARACQDVVSSGAAVRLDPMSAFERKVVHDVVAAAGLVSESEGEEPSRRVVIHPAGA
jgi:spoIIIJ-associated protein